MSVWLLTFFNSAGGLLISVVIKYADNITKAYAQSAAILGATVGSWILFEFKPSLAYWLGAASIVASVILYTSYPANTKHKISVFRSPEETEALV